MIEETGGLNPIYNGWNSGYSRPTSSLLNFDIEDRAIISSQAKILNELEKLNAGEGNEVDLALASVMGRVQVEAAATVIKTKDEMMDSVMEII